MIRLWLTKLLVRLTDIPNAPLPDERTENFLAECWLHEPFQRYLSARERSLERYLARGIGVGGENECKPLRSADYLLGFGQLQELSNLTRICKNAYDAKQDRIKKAQKSVIHTPVDSKK